MGIETKQTLDDRTELPRPLFRKYERCQYTPTTSTECLRQRRRGTLFLSSSGRPDVQFLPPAPMSLNVNQAKADYVASYPEDFLGSFKDLI